MATNLSPINYRPDIDGLRAIAVTLVVIFHAFPNFLTGGFIGVDVFFVISGYLISSIILKEFRLKKFSFLDFYSRRINRIFPSLIVVMLSCYAFGWFNLLADEFKLLGKHIAAGASFISNIVLWVESGYFDKSSDLKPLLHLWSLGIEEQFYLIWPFLIFLCFKYRVSILKIAITIFLITFVINILFIFYIKNPESAFYLPQARFWELMVGSILAYINDKGIPNNLSSTVANWISIIGLCLILICALSISKTNSFPGFWALMPVFGSAALIFSGPNSFCNHIFLRRKWMVWLGLISYPLYLWHWPLLSFGHILYGEAPSFTYRLLAIGASVLLATLTYYLIERPIRFGKFSGIKSIFLTILMVAVCHQGINTYIRDGYVFRLQHLQFRLPPELITLSINAEKPAKEMANAEFKLASQKRPLIFLWGDSYAGHLVYGYEKRFGNDFEIIPLMGGCPALLNTELSNKKNCPEITQANLQRVLDERPSKLVIAANWTDYSNWPELAKTISILKQNGFYQIDLVGPAPQWKETLYKQLYLHYAFNRNIENAYISPYRMNFGLNPNFLKIEPQIKQLAKDFGLHYISIVDILCNEDGCITRFGDTADKLASFDGGHLTNYASEFVVRRFPQK